MIETNIDALDGIMKLVEPIDLLCTDPPYAFGGVGEEHEISATVAVVLREAAQRMRTGAHAVVFCASSWRSMQYMTDAVRGVLVPVRTGRWVKPSARTRVKTVGWDWVVGTISNNVHRLVRLRFAAACEAEADGAVH